MLYLNSTILLEKETEIQQLNKQLVELDSQMEDQINRNCRSTLVFKGIPESKNEKSWDDTTNNLIHTILTYYRANTEQPQSSRMSGDYWYDIIERAHRGGDY